MALVQLTSTTGKVWVNPALVISVRVSRDTPTLVNVITSLEKYAVAGTVDEVAALLNAPVPWPYIGGAETSTYSIALIGANIGGVYAAPALSPSAVLLLGFATGQDMTTPFENFTPKYFALASRVLNPAGGWFATEGKITDPLDKDWTGYTIEWIYADKPQ